MLEALYSRFAQLDLGIHLVKIALQLNDHTG